MIEDHCSYVTTPYRAGHYDTISCPRLPLELNTMQARMKKGLLVWVLLCALIVTGEAEGNLLELSGTITFSSVGRAHYAYDVFSLSMPDSWSPPQTLDAENLKETRLTDGVSLNYNGRFVEGDDRLALDSFISPNRPDEEDHDIAASRESQSFIYVSERTGYPRIYINFTHDTKTSGKLSISAGAVEISVHNSELPFMNDRPSIGGGNLVFVSTVEPSGRAGIGWASVFSTNLKSRKTVRLTPAGVAEYSPAISPSGKWIAAASSTTRGRLENVLDSDLYVYKAHDGSQRHLVAKNGGWPTWLDEKTIFFHRQADDGWWSIYRLDLPANFGGEEDYKLPEPERITPPGVHALTPTAAQSANLLALATRRPQFPKHVRHIELLDLKTSQFIKVTELLSPNMSHYSPFLSSSGKIIGYHRCRGSVQGSQNVPTMEPLPSPLPNLSIFRMDGSFPSFSPDGTSLAFIRDSGDSGLVVPAKSRGIYLINLAGKITQTHIYTGRAFGLVWDPKRTGVMYITAGKCFEPVDEEINILSVSNVLFGKKYVTKQLTRSGTGNNGMPFPSPDGTRIVFRSGRSGYKNLYIMDAVDGEEKVLTRLTDGNWTDNHPRWSASGEWIIFISDRADPGKGQFDIYMVHPDGTGLRRVLNTGPGIKSHPCFLGDERYIVFSSNYAGFSAEPISVGLQFMPQGELFIANVDDPSSLRRLTHNSYEDGSAIWSPTRLNHSDLDRLVASGVAQSLKCNNPDYYEDVFPALGYSSAFGNGVTASSGCAHARKRSMGSDVQNARGKVRVG